VKQSRRGIANDWLSDRFSAFEVYGWLFLCLMLANTSIPVWIPAVGFLVWEAVYYGLRRLFKVND
jgi:hypothetical protein